MSQSDIHDSTNDKAAADPNYDNSRNQQSVRSSVVIPNQLHLSSSYIYNESDSGLVTNGVVESQKSPKSLHKSNKSVDLNQNAKRQTQEGQDKERISTSKEGQKRQISSKNISKMKQNSKKATKTALATSWEYYSSTESVTEEEMKSQIGEMQQINENEDAISGVEDSDQEESDDGSDESPIQRIRQTDINFQNLGDGPLKDVSD